MDEAVRRLAEGWGFRAEEELPSGYCARVYADATRVLKVPFQGEEMTSGLAAAVLLSGGIGPKVYASDAATGILLMERLRPGVPLWQGGMSDEECLGVVVGLARALRGVQAGSLHHNIGVSAPASVGGTLPDKPGSYDTLTPRSPLPEGRGEEAERGVEPFDDPGVSTGGTPVGRMGETPVGRPVRLPEKLGSCDTLPDKPGSYDTLTPRSPFPEGRGEEAERGVEPFDDPGASTGGTPVGRMGGTPMPRPVRLPEKLGSCDTPRSPLPEGRGEGLLPLSAYVDQDDPLAWELLATVPKEEVFLHGDLHHDNILLGADGWRAIDAKGLVGDPAFEPSAFIRNPLQQIGEWEGLPAILEQRILRFSEELELDPWRVWGWSLVAVRDGGTEPAHPWDKVRRALEGLSGRFR